MKKSDGFTLIEVLVSVVVLSVGIVLILHALETATVALSKMRDAIWASNIAQGEFEKLRVRAYGGGDPGNGDSQDTYSTYYAEFRIDRTVGDADLPDGSETSPDVRYVLLTVTRIGSSKSYHYETYVRVVRKQKEEDRG